MRVALLVLALAQAGADIAAVATQVAQAHRRAEGLDHRAAVAELRAALDLPLPPGPDGDQLRGDLHGEIARRLLAAGDAAGAVRAAREGQAVISPAPSPVLALLLLREGEALEASQREEEAMLVYERTIAIARALLGTEAP